MFTKMKAALVALAVGTGAAALTPSAALADNIYFSLGIGGAPAGMVYDDGYRPIDDRRPPRYDRREEQRRHEVDRRRPEACNERQALRKAYRMGLDRPFIARENRRSIVVGGRGDRGRQWIRFANVPGCPVMR